MERVPTYTPETAITISPFSREVEQIKISTQFDPKPWYLLPDVGFNVVTQTDQFGTDILKSGPKEEVFQTAWGKIEQDVIAFKNEYLAKGLLFPIVLKLQETEEGEETEKEIVASLYGNKPLIDTVDEKERYGTVKQSIKQVALYLKDAAPGSTAILASPDGWSGLDQPTGQPITYADSQTYIWRVMEDKSIMGFTVRTDMNLSQNKTFLESFGTKLDSRRNQKEDIAQITNSPIFLPAEQGNKVWQFEDVVDKIKEVKSSQFAYKNKSFEEIYTWLQEPEALWSLDGTTQEFTDQLKLFLWDSFKAGTLNRKDAEIALGLTIVKLSQKLLPQPDSNVHIKADRQSSQTYNKPIINRQEITSGFPPQASIFKPVPQTNYNSIVSQLQEIGGCAGGGNTKNQTELFSETISPRNILTSAIDQLLSSEKVEDFECPRCHGTISGGQGITVCPHCQLSKEEAGSECA
jgi:hypothetical protein